MQKKIICIVCPRGCHMTAQKENNEIKVEGNACKRGREFAILEMTAPKRSLTTTVRTSFHHFPVLPVRTDTDLPKELIKDAMRIIDGIVLDKQVKMHDVIIKDILGTGCNIIASCDLPDLPEESVNK